ncbi:MAG: alpha-amylase family glycosyl hydrolase, partial [Anaerobacillus sp.]
ALFWCNHDQPRIVSRYGNDGEFRRESGKMLATTMHMMQGTPYIYQGEEIGMTNPKFDAISSYRDVESLNIFSILKEEKGYSEEEVLEILRHKSRDNSRTPVQWNSKDQAGFTTGDPWIPVAKNYQDINVEDTLKERNSVFEHYQNLISLRKEIDLITYGDYELLLPEDPQLFVYLRNGEGEKLLVVNNFYSSETTFELPSHVEVNGYDAKVLISNYSDSEESIKEVNLRPYESIVYHLTQAR